MERFLYQLTYGMIRGVVEEQISQIEYFIKKNMDVIVVIPIDGNALYDVLKEAREMGIYIICYDRIVENVNADLIYYH